MGGRFDFENEKVRFREIANAHFFLKARFTMLKVRRRRKGREDREDFLLFSKSTFTTKCSVENLDVDGKILFI